MRVEMELRNVPLKRIQEYLIEAGGELTSDRTASGRGWQAVLLEMEPVRLGVMHIRRDMLVIEGEADHAVKPVYDHMRRSTMRGGG